ncbi:hypothetical protein GCM10023187_51970 [Nibrella viscosa]|uniref:Uncharacterized protein n=1 Tax=Nibrella viscosa TaxID=1084524 RepID=A0ABP8KX49_9BACT
MKKLFFSRLLLLGLLTSQLACAQNRPGSESQPNTGPNATALADSARAWMRLFQQRLQALNGSDSTKWAERQASWLALMGQPNLAMPDLLAPRATFQQQHPTISAGNFVRQLPRHFWLGFRVEMDTVMVQRVDTVKQVVELRVPLGIRGIRADTRQPHRVGEWCLVEWQRTSGPVNGWKITRIAGTEKWLYADPITRRKAQQIEKQLIILASAWLDTRQPDSLRRQACTQLQHLLVTDTIFVDVSDKERRSISIKNCQQLPEWSGRTDRSPGLVSYSLDYVTEIHASADGTLVGERTQLNDVTPSADTDFWYGSRRRDPVPVPAGINGSGLSYWQIRSLIFHL